VTGSLNVSVPVPLAANDPSIVYVEPAVVAKLVPLFKVRFSLGAPLFATEYSMLVPADVRLAVVLIAEYKTVLEKAFVLLSPTVT